MQFQDGNKVYSFDGQDVGRVDHVVLNPKTKEVTHIVVRKGFLFTEDKIIPLQLIASATEGRVSLRGDATNQDKLLPFEEAHYIPLDKADLRNAGYSADSAEALYWYPPMGGWMGLTGSTGFSYPPPNRLETEQNIPEDTLALKEGAQVFSDNNQCVGNVTQVFTDLTSNQMTHFLVAEGALFKEKKLLPVSWIHQIQEGEIHLSVGTSVLDKLHEYEGAL